MTNNKKAKAKRKIKSYVKYSGLAYQLIGLLVVAIFLGLKADAYMGNEKEYITALACILVLFSFFYKVYVSLYGPSKDDNEIDQ